MSKNNNKNNVGDNHELSIAKLFELAEDIYKIDDSFSLSETRVRGIGDNIAFYRTQNGLSQEKLAELLRVDRTTISNWENSKSCPDGWQIEDMAKLFKVDIVELYSKKVYTVSSKRVSHPEEEKSEREWLESHPDDFLNKVKEGEVKFFAKDLVRDYVQIDRVDLITIALELIERGFCVESCYIHYTDGDFGNGVSICLKKQDVENFRNAMSEILINFSTNTSKFQSVIDLRREIGCSNGGTSDEDCERYIKNNRTLSKYHVLYDNEGFNGIVSEYYVLHDGSPQKRKVLAYGTDIKKTYEVLEKLRPRSFSIESIDESSYQPDFSRYVEDFDWNKLEDEK